MRTRTGRREGISEYRDIRCYTLYMKLESVRGRSVSCYFERFQVSFKVV